MLVVDVARVVLDPEALDDAELDTGADEVVVDDELLVDDAVDDADDKVEDAVEEDDVTDELLDDPEADANDEDDVDEDVDEDVDHDETEDEIADDEDELGCKVVPDEDVADEVGTAVVDSVENAVAVVIREELPCATAAGFSLYMVRRLPLPQISELFPAQVIEQSLWSVALTAAGLSVEPHQHSCPYSRPA